MKPRIVIVDDSRAIQAILSRVIQSAGLAELDLHTFSSAAEALAFVGNQGADLVITDWHMPGMSGLELLQAVRQLAGSRIQVGMVTTESAEDLLGQATRGGASFILRKPFKDVVLQEAVKTALSAAHQATADMASDAATQNPPAAREDTPSPSTSTLEALQVFSRESLKAELEDMLRRQFGSIKFRLVEQQEPALSTYTPQVLRGLISPSTGRAVSALTLLDATVILMLSGAANLSKPEVVRPLIAAGTADAAAVEHAKRFMLTMATALVPASDQRDGPPRVRCSMVPRQFPKLQESFARRERLRSFKLQVPGYGEGYMAVFLP
jgi:CheY-like chemotaxis protein